MHSITAKSDNLDSFREGSYVFDNEHSDVRVLAGHRASIVFPTLPTATSTDFHNVILKGEVIGLDFSASQEIATPKFRKGFSIHAQTYPLWPAARALHEKGVADGKAFLAGTGVTIVGAEASECPKVLYLDKVHLKLDLDVITADPQLLRLTCERVNQVTGRQTYLLAVGENLILVAPASWILQDHTAILQGAKQDPKTAIPIIKLPVVFPTIGSKILYSDANQENRFAIIRDFDVVGGGQRVEVTISDSHTGDSTSMLYSRIYVTRMEDVLNPKIQRVITPKEYATIKITYIEDGRDHIFKQLTKWGMWRICSDDKGLKVLTATYTKDKKTKPEYKWMFADEVIGRKDLNLVSFEDGDVTIDGKSHRIKYRSERSDPLVPEIYLHDIPLDKSKDETKEGAKSRVTIDRFCFNAVIGTAEIVVAGGKKVSCYFSTKNGMDLSMSSTPLFAPLQPTGRPVVDVKNFNWVIGYQGKAKEKGHEAEIVLYWTYVTPGLRNFYTWVSRRGQHESFVGKKSAELRALFECSLYPNLVDAYNFMVEGLKTTNPTRFSAWTTWFVRHCLAIDQSDLL